MFGKLGKKWRAFNAYKNLRTLWNEYNTANEKGDDLLKSEKLNEFLKTFK